MQRARRFNVLACGRRWGKSTLGINLEVGPALEGYPVAWFSPNYKYLEEIWLELGRVLHPVTAARNASKHRIDLISGGVVEMWSLDDPNAGRSRKYKRVIVDEAAMVAHLGQWWTEAGRATLADFRGDAWFKSTPKGLNYFHTLYQRGQDPGELEWASFQSPTSTNPFIHPDEIEAARRDSPERVFAQEYMAEFLEFEGAVFRRVMEAAIATAQDCALPAHRYVMGVDWGKMNDFTVIAVIDSTTGELAALDRFNQIDYAFQRRRLRALWERFGESYVIAESNSMGVPVIEELTREGINVQPFQTTNASKAEAIEGLALAFERGELRILPDPVLTGELLAYQAERLPSGMLRYSAPEGLHDDTVMALALAWYGASRPMGVEYAPSPWN